MHLFLQDCATVIFYYFGCPKNSLNSLQLIHNAAARILMRTNRRDHVSPVLASLHWLPVEFRIEFKFSPHIYIALNDQAPSHCTIFSKQSESLSECRFTCGVSKIRMGGRAFSYQAPLLACMSVLFK